MSKTIDEIQKSYDVTQYEIDIDALEIHDAAKITPLMSNMQFQAFKQDLEANGQREPGLLYRGKVVDGRHRLRALRELGVPTMKFIKLPNNYTVEQVMADVKSREKRRHNSTALLAIMAYNETKSEGLTQQEAAAKYGIPRERVSQVKRIAETLGRKDIIDWLFQGEKLDIGNEHKSHPTDSLTTIINWLVANKGTILRSPIDDIKMSSEELTEDEWLVVTSVINKINKEKVAVRREIAKGLYKSLPVSDAEDVI